MENLKEHSILVTGAAGFIGSNFVRCCIRHDAGKVVSLDKLSYAGNLKNLADIANEQCHIFVKADICDEAEILELLHTHEITAVVNFAAETHVDRSILSADPFVQSNVVGTTRLLEATRRYLEQRPHGFASKFRFVHISTDEIYGSLELDEVAKAEDDVLKPNSPYSATKAASNHLVRAYRETHGLPTLITNCTNNYGPFQYPEKLVPVVILNGVLNKEIPVYGSGTNIRDWIFVEDHCRGIVDVLTHGELGETYNIAADNEVDNLALVQKICDLLDTHLGRSGKESTRQLINFVSDRPGHDFRYSLDSGKLKRLSGWTPKISFEAGLNQTVAWYLDNSAWVSSLIGKDDYQQWVADNYLERVKR